MKKVLIVTGGSGGHVIPAISIYDHLKNNFEVFLITDERGKRFIDQNKYRFDVLEIPNLFSNLLLLPLKIFKFFFSIINSFRYLRRNNIEIIISTGGYMSYPICFAGKILKADIFLFEPNSVLGRSNKYMLSIAKKIVCYNLNLKNLPKKFQNKIFPIEPILRKEIYFLEKNTKSNFENIKRILVLGGSQGAKFFDHNVMNLIIEISKFLKIEVHQQIFDEKSKFQIEEKYLNSNIIYTLFKFDHNLFEKINSFDLAITRSGASAISELVFFNIPFFAIPFPYAKDNHQYFNARFYEEKRCCWIINQHDFNIQDLSKKIINLFNQNLEYLEIKKNLKNNSNQNTWNNINKKLINLINEN